MNRQEAIDRGLVWQVYTDTDRENILFEGKKTACFRHVNDTYGMAAWRNGEIRIGRLIWEDLNIPA